VAQTNPDEEVLPGGPGLPRWVVWLAGTVTLVLLVGVAVKLSASEHPAKPRPTGASSSPPAVSSRPAGPEANGVATGVPLMLPDPSQPLDVTVIGNEAWLLQPGRLSTFTTDADYTTRRIAVIRAGDQARLFVDSAMHRVWVVVLDSTNSTIEAFDSSTLAPLQTSRWGPAITSAAPLTGALYLATGSGVFRLAPGARVPTELPGTTGPSGELAADPGRGRVLLVRPTTRAAVFAITAAGARYLRYLPIDLASGSLAVTGSGEIWLGGFGATGAVLVRLDPRTLAPAGSSPLAAGFGPGAEIVAAGTDDLLVGSGDGSARLQCLSGADGRRLQSWPLAPRTATSTHRSAYVIVGGGVVPLELHGACTG
jgi:hypothetical protein